MQAWVEFKRWLGPLRAGLLIGLLVAGGLAVGSIQVAFDDKTWTPAAQVALVGAVVAGTGFIVSTRLPASKRRQWWLALGPGLLLWLVGIFRPGQALLLGGIGLGWIVVAQFVLRSPVRMEYQAAIRHLRRSEFAQAVAVMDGLIAAEGSNPDHYHFRAELHRLAGSLERASEDYRQVIALSPAAAAGYTGLAEVYAQQGDYTQAREVARQALEHESQHWMTAYNLGLIEDRLGHAADAVHCLETALQLGVPHSRYRLLTYLWLARNYYRQGQIDAARQHIAHMRRQAGGLRDWRTILSSEQAAPLRQLLEADVRLAEQLLEAGAPLDLLDAAG